MNAILTTAVSKPWLLHEDPPPYNAPGPPPRTRVAVFGSLHGGYRVLHTLVEDFADTIELVGVATDDLSQPYTHATVRLWKYPHTRAEELLVPLYAESIGLEPFTGRVKSDEFHRTFTQDWRPDLCLMATFGQLIPERIFTVPHLGFYNFHHSDVVWPSYPGPDPIRDMVRDGKTHVVITMHEVTEVLDGGRFVARSHPVPLPPDANAVIVHRLTWPQMGPFIRREVGAMLPAVEAMPTSAPLVLQDAVVPYRTAGDRECPHRVAA